MNPTSSAVALLAANTRSPSFSRSASSTTTTALPGRWRRPRRQRRPAGSSPVIGRRRTTVGSSPGPRPRPPRARIGRRGSCARQRTGAVRRTWRSRQPPDSRRSPASRSPRVVWVERRRDQRHREPVSVIVVTNSNHGQRDPVDRDRALLRDVAGQLRRHRDRPPRRSPRTGLASSIRPDAVDVALHDVAAELGGRGGGAFQVHRGSGSAGAPSVVAPQRLGHDVGAEPGRLAIRHRQAHTVDGDRVADVRGRRPIRSR